MNTYLVIITTFLVLTQIIRVIQNSINLHNQNQQIKREIAWIKDVDVSKQDFETQKEVFRLLREKLENEPLQPFEEE